MLLINLLCLLIHFILLNRNVEILDLIHFGYGNLIHFSIGPLDW